MINEAMNTDGITHITFDCYGTLIDWECMRWRTLPRVPV